MKNLTALFMSLMLVFSLAACSSNQQPQTSMPAPSSELASEITSKPVNSESTSNSSTEPKVVETENGKTLVVYFSWSGNTKEMANTIAAETGGDLYEIIPVNAYPEDYDECTDVALEERDSNARPEIANLPKSIDEYDRIIIGYPIWWHTAPMIIGTFLESYDLTDVDIYPFVQSASMNEEQFENSMEFVREAVSDANIHDGLFASASDTKAITAYLEQNALTE